MPQILWGVGDMDYRASGMNGIGRRACGRHRRLGKREHAGEEIRLRSKDSLVNLEWMVFRNDNNAAIIEPQPRVLGYLYVVL